MRGVSPKEVHVSRLTTTQTHEESPPIIGMFVEGVPHSVEAVRTPGMPLGEPFLTMNRYYVDWDLRMEESAVSHSELRARLEHPTPSF